MANAGNPAQAQQPAPNVYNQSAQLFNGAGAATAGAMGMPDIGAYQNPFTQQVTDRSIADLQRSQAMATNTLDAQAGAAGAFGGSRHGVAQGMVGQDYAKQIADTTAGLNMQGFNSALGAAQQGQQTQLAGAAQLGNLSNLGFGFGQQIGQQQSQQGALQQAMQQALIDAGRSQYAGYTNSPMTALQAPLAALGASNMGQNTTTNTKTPGLFDYLSAGLSIAPALICWVAREVYGPEDPKWLEFREWMLRRAPRWLLVAYIRHGEAVAGVVRRVPVLKRVIRPLMDRARRTMGGM
jgi:hypothetical protein